MYTEEELYSVIQDLRAQLHEIRADNTRTKEVLGKLYAIVTKDSIEHCVINEDLSTKTWVMDKLAEDCDRGCVQRTWVKARHPLAYAVRHTRGPKLTQTEPTPAEEAEELTVEKGVITVPIDYDKVTPKGR